MEHPHQSLHKRQRKVAIGMLAQSLLLVIIVATSNLAETTIVAAA